MARMKKTKRKIEENVNYDLNDRRRSSNESKNKSNKMCNWHESRENDPLWYTLNDQLLFDAANIPYSWPLGGQLNLGEFGSDLNNQAIPGIFAIYTMPSIGNAQDPNAPVNTAMRNIYSYIRHANSGAANYDAPDLMMYLLAMDSCYAFLAWMKRIYGVIQTYNPENRYYPMGIIQSMTVNFDDIQRNLADFRMYINVFANKIGSMCIPASMSYMAKHAWMYEGIYLDGVSAKSQTYLFNPYGFLYYDLYKYDGNGEDTRGVLKLMPMTGRSALLTREDIYSIGNALINPILASQDFNIMSGDILKAFGEANVVKAEEIPESYAVLPTYSMEVLDQIENLIMVGDVAAPHPYATDVDFVLNGIGSVIVDQSTQLDTGFLYNRMHFTENDEPQSATIRPTGFNYLMSDKIITFQYDEITTANTMEATRLTNTLDNPSTASNCGIVVTGSENNARDNTYDKYMRWVCSCDTMGSEVACFGRVYYYAVNSKGQLALLNTEKFYTTHACILATVSNVNSNVEPQRIADKFSEYNKLLTSLSTFDRHPALVPVLGVYQANITRAPGSNTIRYTSPVVGVEQVMSRSVMNGMMFDINKYAIVSKQVLKNMTQTALLSEFNVRQFGKSDKFTNILL
nr:capsid protein [Rat picobirnavirus]